MRKRSKVILVISAVVVAAVIGFVAWAQTPLGPMPEVDKALQSDSVVDVSTDRWITFTPIHFNKSTGFIVYPGGRVHYSSYAPLCHALSARGYLAVLVPMPLNLAVFGVNKAKDVIKSHPDIKVWVIGGHSLGGTMAAQFAHNNPSLIKGLVLWSSYPASSDDFSKMNLAVTTIHGTNDGIVSTSQIGNSLNMFPNDANRVEIAGGNHSQFGWYGDQPGDNEATISREVQQEQIVNATIQLLEKAGTQ
jgi:pimeloyl-ACP methyl ester carboxylesterase